jgi:hypothetical protein
MHPASKSLLSAHLAALRENGTSGSILFMTAVGTSDGLLAGVEDGVLQLDYPRAGIFDFRRVFRFRQYCATYGYRIRTERWGKELIYRAGIGSAPIVAADAIDGCFTAVYGKRGPFALEFRPVGWAAV